MKRLLLSVLTIVGVFLGSFTIAAATTTFITQQGGTGTSSPSGILYGDNGSTNHLNTVIIGNNLTFSGGTLSATGGGGGGSNDPFYHPAIGQSATTTLLLLFGNASTTQFTATSTIWFTGLGSAGLLAANSAGLVYPTATSSIGATGPITFSGTSGAQVGGASGTFGCATCALTTRNLTIAGTAQQITSSAGAQDLSADRTWTLSLPNYVLFPLSLSVTNATTTNATTTTLYFTGLTSGELDVDASGKVYKAASTTFTGSGPVTLTYSNGQVTGGCSTCNTSNATVSSISLIGLDGVTPLTTTGTIIAQVGTSTAITAGQLAEWTSNGTPSNLTSLSTTTLAISGPFINTANLGALVGGSNATFTYTGLATTTNIAANQVLFGTSASGVSSVGTTTISHSGPFQQTANAGGLVGGSNLTVTWTGLATTSQPTAGQLLESNGNTGVFGVSTTSTGTASNVLFLTSTSSTIIPYATTTALSAASICLTGDTCRTTWPASSNPGGTAGQLQYNASGSLAGISTTTLTLSGFPATIPSGYGKLVGGSDTTWTWWGLATSTAIAANQVLFGTSASGVSSVGTTTLSLSGPFISTANIGGLVGGSNATFTYTGIATSSNLTAGQLLMSNGGANVSSVATTSVSAGAGLTGTLTTLKSTDSIALSVPVTVANGGTNSTSLSANAFLYTTNAGTTVVTAASSSALGVGTLGQVWGYTGAGGGWVATSSSGGSTNAVGGTNAVQFANGTSFNGNQNLVFTGTAFGIGTSTPWGISSIGTNNLSPSIPSFVIASSSNTGGMGSTTQFIVQNGNVGIGTSSPFAPLSIFVSTTSGATGPTNTLFAIGSSTNGTATTTLLAVNNIGQTILPSGTAGAPSLTFSGSTDTGVFSSGAGLVTLSAGAGARVTVSSASVTVAPVLLESNGSVSAPSYSFNNNTNTGLFDVSGALAFTTGGVEAGRFSIAPSLLGLGTTTPEAELTIASSTGAQLLLTDGLSSGAAPFYSRMIAGNYYFGTSSPTTFATSSTPIITITPSSTANATTTLTATDFFLKQTSPTAFSINDGFNTGILNIQTSSTTGAIFTVAATTSTPTNLVSLFSEDQYGHLTASSTFTPTVSSCGTSPTLEANANDSAGTIDAGTGSPSSCTVTFGRPFATTPIPIISDNSTTVTADISSISTTGFSVSLSAGLSSVHIYYVMIQP